MTTAAEAVGWLDIGLTGYAAAFAVQEELHRRRKAGEVGDVILFQENYPVITIGRSGGDGHLLVPRARLSELGIELYPVSRGGDITYHGPGQLVVSPVIRLQGRAMNVHQYVRLLEQVIIDLLAGYGVTGRRVEGASGVWVGNEKIAALGIAVKNGITQHGVAINVSQDLTPFHYIVPCGLKNRGVTSLAALCGAAPSLAQVRAGFLGNFARVFAVQVAAQQVSLCEVNSRWSLK